jgi:aflatoxin B1 aldehyde reductase
MAYLAGAAVLGACVSRAAGLHTSTSAPLKIVLGSMTYGDQTDKAGAVDQLKYFASLGPTYDTVDTARMYSYGLTEQILGEIFHESPELQRFKVDSKVNPFKGYNENLSPDNVMSQADSILQALKCSSINVLYLHAPDKCTPIEETLQAVQKLYELGRFKELGLSNYPAWEVVYIHSYCQQRGWVLPTVYQGMYNPLTREVERELFPALEKLNIRFYAFNPLCGGLLTGKHKYESLEESTGTRFDKKSSYENRYTARYWNKEVGCLYMELCWYVLYLCLLLL